MFASKLFLTRLAVYLRETAFHALNRYAYRTGLTAFAFDPEDVDTKAAIAVAVAEATEKLEKKNRELIAEKRKAGDGKVDQAEVDRLESELETTRTQLNDANKQLKAAAKQAETATAALTAEQAHTQKLLVENGLVTALTEAGVKDPTLLKAAAALIREGHKPAIVVDGEARVAKVGDKSLGEFVKAWSLGDEGKAFVAAPGNSGGGAGGSGSGGGKSNPWAKETFSLTEQGRLYTENPAQAKALAAEHGVTL